MIHSETNGFGNLSIADVPVPTEEYAERLSEQRVIGRALPKAQPTPIPIPVPIPISQGARVMIWKQDPTVAEVGIRKAFLPKRVFAGPKDARIVTQGLPVVTPNIFGDLIIDPIGNPEAFDAVHTFAVVRMVLTMYERLETPVTVPWQWNSGGNTDPLSVFPHAGVTQNAFYTRAGKALKFFFFDSGSPPQTIFTCRSLDIVAHETGHAVLDGLKPGWLGSSNTPQTGALHEAFGDLTSIFLALSQFDQVEAIVAQTKANLHATNFLAALAEQFGSALGSANGLRNADNDLKLSQVGSEVHSLSRVFTGGVYDVLADIFLFERKPAVEDDASTLYRVGRYVYSLVFRALAQSPNTNAGFADVVNKMLAIVTSDGKPVQYKQSIVNRFAFREVITPVALKGLSKTEHSDLEAAVQDEEGAVQDRSRCCGTMQLEEYLEDERGLEEELKELADVFSGTTPKRKKEKVQA
jgi:hypothetical protein